MAANPERGLPALTPETFRDTLRGTWAERYRRALARYPEAKYLYWAAALLRRYGFPLERRTVLPLARDLLPEWNPWVRWARLPRALRDLERREALYTPRDGQLEAAGPPEVDETAVVRFLIRLGEQHRLADALYNLARKLMQPEGAPSAIHHPDAARILQKVTAWQPENPAAWYHLGVAYALAGQHEQAIQAFQKAIALDPKFATPWNGLGNVYRALGRYDEAIQAYQQAIALDPKDAAPWNNLGNVYRDLGRYEEAIQAYQQAIALDPKFALPWNGLGNVYALRGEWEQALEAFRRAAELAPERGVYHASVASALRALGREAEAQEEIARARPLMEKENEYNRACFAAICGEREEALRLLEIALQKRQVSRQWARRDPDLRSLHGDPRFEKLVGAG
jgi:tetratricopeptide (TPR) repeat protein